MSIADELFHEKGERDEPRFFYARDGLRLGGVFVLAAQHVPVVAPDNTAENVLFSLVIPAGLMAKNDALRISPIFTFTNNANQKTLAVKIGADYLIQKNRTTANSEAYSFTLRNRNALNSQIHIGAISGGDFVMSSASPVNTTAINFAVDQTLAICATKAVALDVLKLESILVEIVRGLD